jgi:general secretion pathway protein K
MTAPRRPRPQRGAALLIAMLILTLVATLASAMVWHQQRAIDVEAAERARAQAGWVLLGALDWARLILREDGRSGGADHAGEPWAVPLSEARLSTFLAADKDNTDAGELDAFLSGAITDVQARYNLRRLVSDDGKPVALEVQALRRLCEAVGVTASVADRLAEGLAAAWYGEAEDDPLPPTRVSQLGWLGIDPDSVARLARYVVILPVRTPVNANTAPREVLLAAIDDIDMASAERIVQTRQREALGNVQQLRQQLPAELQVDDARVGVSTRFFEVQGRLRLDDRVLEELSLVERRQGGEVLVLRRERRSLQTASP